ncbi:MAG: sigma 54-interacting transcriptional regulator [Firmicutes bacterium]|nr:sigma 54-interacting transcriptional regulator [Bacillota bacterium]
MCRVNEAYSSSKLGIESPKYWYILETIFDNPYEGILVVDENGYIVIINNAYVEFLGLESANDIIGKHVTEAIDNTRLHIVIKTRKPEVFQLQTINNRNILCNRIPIMQDGELIGAFCHILFQDDSDLSALAKRIAYLQSELEYYRDELAYPSGARYTIDSIVGNSKKVRELKKEILKVASTQSTVLIRGESGTGKELVAHAIHNSSLRSQRPFIKVSCAALPESLFESELFGYTEGAFTGAQKGGKIGKFEAADGGTIFLDEIGDMPLNMQVKILRLLQEREVERLGAIKPKKIDVRVIAATNQNLEELVKEDRFRHDLFYRLNVVTITVPPLRDRLDDIAILSEYFISKLSRTLGFEKKTMGQQALEVLYNHSWPGNVRELENVVERALNFADYNDEIKVSHLPSYIVSSKDGALNDNEDLVSLRQALETAERAQIKKALTITEYNNYRAAKLLGISKSSLYEKVKKYGLGSKGSA